MLRSFWAISIAVIFIYTITGCSDDASVNAPAASGDWLIPVDQIFDGGPGKDGITALLNPQFSSVSGIGYLDDNDLIIGVKIGEEIRGYPHDILDWHEIINDQVGDSSFAVTYCPLTGSGIGWNRKIQGQVTTFGVSGLLYNTNLIPYDRATNSNWSQMGLMSVNGPHIGREAELIPMIETSWKTWKTMYPESKVVTVQTGYSKPYGTYPYGDYRTNNNRLIFPVNVTDSRLSQKERVLGVLAPSGLVSKVYRIAQFPDGIGIAQNNIGGESVVVAGSAGQNFAVAFLSELGSTLLTFSPVQDQLPVIMVDNEGTSWDIFGNGISGPRAGQKLQSPRSFTAYWFAWAAFFPGAEIAVF